MGPFRKLLLVAVGVAALHGLQACASDTELNPQPLPPQGGGETTRSPEEDGKNSDPGSGFGGETPAPADTSNDGGAEGGDASDAGAD